jgi:hypothetical protein
MVENNKEEEKKGGAKGGSADLLSMGEVKIKKGKYMRNTASAFLS